MFTIAGCSYLVALLVIHVLAPRLEPVRLDSLQPRGFDVIPK
jgi:hypothetical protein